MYASDMDTQISGRASYKLSARSFASGFRLLAHHIRLLTISLRERRPLQEALELVAKVARTDANVIIFGESGTGKELVAKLIHTCSQKAEGDLFPVDCASLPDNLLKQSYSVTKKVPLPVPPIASQASWNWLIAALYSLSLKSASFNKSAAKLLRALQQRQHRRLGGTKMVDFDVRVVSEPIANLRAVW